jgi:hypothetical protein
MHQCLNLSARHWHFRLGIFSHLKNPKCLPTSTSSRNVYVAKIDFRGFFDFGLIIGAIHPSKSKDNQSKEPSK